MAIDKNPVSSASNTSNGPRLRKDGTPFAKRGEGAAAVKKPAYLIYKVLKDETSGVATGEIEISLATRKADEVLQAVTKDRDLKYTSIEI